MVCINFQLPRKQSNESIALERQKKYLLQAFAGHIILYCN